jgi:fucose permease
MIVLLAESHFAVYVGMAILGSGLAACFPVVMGYVTDRYKSLSGTALSMVLVLALLGNMLINYGMGIVANDHGTGIMPAVLAGGIFLQLFLLLLVLKRNR